MVNNADFFEQTCLGTVQFGLNYGVSNKNGQIADADVQRILELAHHYNVSRLDTAADYGDCERVLSKYPETLQNFSIATKSIKTSNIQEKKFSKIKTDLIESIETSLDILGMKSFDLYYLRSPETLFQYHREDTSKYIAEIKEKGLVNKIGISIYEEKQLNDILEVFQPDVIQIPFNILDQRLSKSGTLKSLKAKGIEIYARSLFLQGLLLMQSDQIPNFFRPIKSHLQQIHSQLTEYSLSPLQACLLCAFQTKEIDKIILGVSSLKEWKEILKTIAELPNHPLDWSSMSLDNEIFLNPSKWAVN